MKEKDPISLAIAKSARLIKRFIDGSENGCKDDMPTRNQGRIIRFIYCAEEKAVFQKDIEKEFGIRRSTATNTLKLMEKNGLIKREHVAYDDRLKKLSLTDEAFKNIEQFEKDMKKINEILEKGISEEEREVFFTVLEKIKNNIEEV